MKPPKHERRRVLQSSKIAGFGPAPSSYEQPSERVVLDDQPYDDVPLNSHAGYKLQGSDYDFEEMGFRYRAEHAKV